MSVLRARVLRLSIAAALIGAGLVAGAPGVAAAATPPCQRTYWSDWENLAIPDGTGSVASQIDVPEDGLVVTDVDVKVNLFHTGVGDLQVALASMTDVGGTRSFSDLFDHSGSDGDNLYGTVFDDEAGIPVNWGDPPYTGRFMPDDPLAGADGATGGNYVLIAFDTSAGETGSIMDWYVTLTYASCDFDADGVEDHRDSCLGVDAHTATGCPLTARALTAKYRLGKFKGALSSPVVGCAAHRSVTVWKVRSGADRQVGTATSRADGSYRLKRAKKLGRYYATSPRVVVTGVAECPAVTSRTFRIR